MTDKLISPLEQNPVDYYNLNFIDDATKILLQKNKALEKTGKVFKEIIGTDTEEVYKIKNGYFEVLSVNSLGLTPGMLYSPFQILTRFIFDNKFMAAYYHVGMTYLNMNFPYVRIGIKYFKVTEKTDRYGIKRTNLSIWNKEEIKEDYGKEMLANINKFDDFVIAPDNENHCKSVNGNYNLYAPFPHTSIEYDIDKEPQKIEWSLRLTQHIFGDQSELGLKYLKVLYEHPMQALPILVLTSEARSTGKSTFVDWLSVIFGANMVIINPQDISSSFNSSYATSNIIAIEESRFDSVQATEKLKALATQKSLLVNTKFVAPYTTPFYGKLIITSNDEAKFSKVDQAEIRYWVRRVPQIAEGMANHNILADLTEEIPYFLHYLSQLPEVDRSKSRQVFTPEEIDTDALSTVKHESKPELQKEIEILIDQWFMENASKDEMFLTASDIKSGWFSHDVRYTRSYILKVLTNNLKLEAIDGGGKVIRYKPFTDPDGITEKVGRKVFKVSREDFSVKVELEPNGLFIEDPDDMPF